MIFNNNFTSYDTFVAIPNKAMGEKFAILPENILFAFVFNLWLHSRLIQGIRKV